jgi:hypothetical protein
MFMTPRGLKIRLEIPHGFTLIERLRERDPSTDAFRVLKTVEGLETIPKFSTFAFGIVALLVVPNYWYVLGALVLGSLAGKLLTMFGVFVPPLVLICTGLSWITGFGLFMLLGLAIAWIVRGWPFAVSWFGGVVAGYVAREFIVEPMRMKYYKNRVDYPLTSSEVNFINAYRFHANRLGVTMGVYVAEEEIESGNWIESLKDYATKYPQAVARFVSF